MDFRMHGATIKIIYIFSLLKVIIHPEVVVIIVLGPLWCKKNAVVLERKCS
jgi:hypothetical protein